MSDRTYEFGLGGHAAMNFGGYAIPAIVCTHTNISTCSNLDLSRSHDWVLQAARKLEVIGRLKYNWDSYGALPLNTQARQFTVQVLRWLGDEDLPPPAVVLESDGTIQMEWRAKGKELDVGLVNGDRIEYVKVDANGDVGEGAEQIRPVSKLRELTGWLMRD